MSTYGVSCPNCGSHRSTVEDGRESSGAFRRRRTCVSCKERYTTYEVVGGTIPSDLYERLENLSKTLKAYLTDMKPEQKPDYEFIPRKGMVLKSKSKAAN